MSLMGFYQAGYVTRDLEGAVAICAEAMGVESFQTMDVELPAVTSGGPRTIGVRVGVAWAGPLQIELIQPVSGFIEPYVDLLPADPNDVVPRLHHLAVRRDSIVQMRAEAERMRAPVVFETGGNGITSLFVDARTTLGHYLEMVSATPEGWAMLGWPST